MADILVYRRTTRLDAGSSQPHKLKRNLYMSGWTRLMWFTAEVVITALYFVWRFGSNPSCDAPFYSNTGFKLIRLMSPSGFTAFNHWLPLIRAVSYPVAGGQWRPPAAIVENTISLPQPSGFQCIHMQGIML